MTTVDQIGRLVLDFYRCAMLPLSTGIETGRAVLGDVGRGAKRDYTAYGRTVNLASRLEGSNKKFGSSIALGPGTAAALAGRIPLRSSGKFTPSGIADGPCGRRYRQRRQLRPPWMFQTRSSMHR